MLVRPGLEPAASRSVDHIIHCIIHYTYYTQPYPIIANNRNLFCFHAGTLLGAYRMGDIRPYDHDAGVSFLVDSATSQAFLELDTAKNK